MIDVLRLMVHTGDAPAAPMAPFHSNQDGGRGYPCQLHFPFQNTILAAHAAHA